MIRRRSSFAQRWWAVWVAAVLSLLGCGVSRAQEPEFAGSEACGACHQDLHQAFQRNKHHTLESSPGRGWEGRSCEACHGRGAKHAESASPDDILNPRTQPDSLCLGCHTGGRTSAGGFQSEHARNSVGCTTCHTMHQEPARLAARTPDAVNSLCSGCHLSVWAQFQRPHRHNLPEGAASCVDCHNQHGGAFQKSARTAFGNETGCFRCHGDKRGPFAFEHAPVRLEGCTSCHEPHGSQNPRMLIRSEQRFLCLECHASVGAAQTLGGVPPAIHDLRSPRYRNCTICHVKVHGSHVNRSLLR